MSKEIHPSILELSAKLQPGMKVEKDGKSEIDPQSYIQTLPEGVTVEAATALHEHHSVFIPAVAHAFSNVAIEAMQKDKKLDSLSLAVPMIGKDTLNVTFDRSKEVNAAPGSSEKKTVYGVLSVSLDQYAAKPKVGAFKAVREDMAARALSAFGG